ncbi:MAG: RDD family protein [Candidatus Sulfotelmatobacter sp.]
MSSFQTITGLPPDDRIRVSTPEQIALEFPLAGLGSRFMGLAVDSIIQSLLYVGGIFAMAAIGKYARFLPAWLNRVPESWLPALLVTFLFCVYWGYFAIFEFAWKGRTPGKRLAGIRVIKNTGRALNVYEVVGRNLLRVVDWLPFGYAAGIITMAISKENQRLGDLLAGSIVVHEKHMTEFRPDLAIHVADADVPNTSANPGLSKITPEELVLIETYLQRRGSFDLAVRDSAAEKIAARITAKTGVERPREQTLEEFLESVARQVRDSIRFR